MHQKSLDVLRRSDRVFAGVLIAVFAAVSAAVGAAAAYRPHTDQLPAAAAAPAPVAVQPADDGFARRSALSPAEQLVLTKLLAEHRCLAEAMYYEARGEGVSGEKAIAEVVFHRMRTGNYGHSICAVVYEGAGQPHCQFSFACNGDLALKKQPEAWTRAQVLAARILTGEERLEDETDGATNFHSISVEPEWAQSLQRTVQIGNHIFYRDGLRSRAM